MDTPGLRVDRRGDEVEIEWRLPPNVNAPALQLLLLRRTPSGIAVEPRTTPLTSAGGTTVVVVPDLHSLRAAAGRVRDDGTFIPIVRLSAQAAQAQDTRGWFARRGTRRR